MAYDVTDDVPKNSLYDKQKELIPHLTGSFQDDKLESEIIANLTRTYLKIV